MWQGYTEDIQGCSKEYWFPADNYYLLLKSVCLLRQPLKLIWLATHFTHLAKGMSHVQIYWRCTRIYWRCARIHWICSRVYKKLLKMWQGHTEYIQEYTEDIQGCTKEYWFPADNYYLLLKSVCLLRQPLKLMNFEHFKCLHTWQKVNVSMYNFYWVKNILKMCKNLLKMSNNLLKMLKSTQEITSDMQGYTE